VLIETVILVQARIQVVAFDAAQAAKFI